MKRPRKNISRAAIVALIPGHGHTSKSETIIIDELIAYFAFEAMDVNGVEYRNGAVKQ